MLDVKTCLKIQIQKTSLTGVCELIGAAYLTSFFATSNWLNLAARCRGVKPFYNNKFPHKEYRILGQYATELLQMHNSGHKMSQIILMPYLSTISPTTYMTTWKFS